MSEDTSNNNEAPIKVDFGGAELLPELKPLWESLFEHHVAGGAAGLAVQKVEDTWPLRLARYERLFERQPAFVLLAKQGKKPVAYVLAYADEPLDEDGDAPVITIESLAVIPEMRGQGLGAWLLEEAENEAIEEWGASATVLEIMTGNESGRGFYDRAGFSEVGETWLRPAPEGTAVDEIEIDDDRLGELLDEGTEIFALGLEEGPDDTWITSEVLLGCQPLPGFPVDGDALAGELSIFAEAGAVSALVALDGSTDPAWREVLKAQGFTKVLTMLTREIIVQKGQD